VKLYDKALHPGVSKYWKEKTGRMSSSGILPGSGAQSRAIIGGFEADIAAHIARRGYRQERRSRPHHSRLESDAEPGMVIALRFRHSRAAGESQRHKDWADLAHPGLNVLTPDPKTSGRAQWNSNAIYGAALRGFPGVAKDDKAAARVSQGVLRKSRSLDKRARDFDHDL